MCIVWMFRTTTSLVNPAWSTKLISERCASPGKGLQDVWGSLPFHPRQNARRDSAEAVIPARRMAEAAASGVGARLRGRAGGDMRTVGTSSTHQHFVLKMSASLAKQFEDCAARCLELARAAKTAGRARFMQMTREYESAAALIRQEPLHLSAFRRMAPRDRSILSPGGSAISASTMAGQHAQPALAERGDHTPVCLSASSSSEMSLSGLSRSVCT